MVETKVDVDLLVRCAGELAALQGAPCPSEDLVRAVIDKVLNERNAVTGVRMGLITEDEAVSLLLSHFHTTLLIGEARHPTAESWNHQGLRAAIRSAMFGASK